MGGKKLVRDKIPELFPGQNHYSADDKEYYEELIKKLQEEVDEFKESEEVEELEKMRKEELSNIK